MMRRYLLLAGFLASFAGTGAAEVYRWIDQNGVVNYGSAPPAGVKASPLDTDTARVSVVPALPRPAGSAEAAQADLRVRVDRLENHLEEEKRLRALAEAADADRLNRARAECEAQRRLDCDADPYGRHQAAILVQPVRRSVFFRHGTPGFHTRPPAPQSSGEPVAVRRSVIRQPGR